jgi:hypothetical protein
VALELVAHQQREFGLLLLYTLRTHPATIERGRH